MTVEQRLAEIEAVSIRHGPHQLPAWRAVPEKDLQWLFSRVRSMQAVCEAAEKVHTDPDGYCDGLSALETALHAYREVEKR